MGFSSFSLMMETDPLIETLGIKPLKTIDNPEIISKVCYMLLSETFSLSEKCTYLEMLRSKKQFGSGSAELCHTLRQNRHAEVPKSCPRYWLTQLKEQTTGPPSVTKILFLAGVRKSGLRNTSARTYIPTVTRCKSVMASHTCTPSNCGRLLVGKGLQGWQPFMRSQYSHSAIQEIPCLSRNTIFHKSSTLRPLMSQRNCVHKPRVLFSLGLPVRMLDAYSAAQPLRPAQLLVTVFSYLSGHPIA